MSSRGSVLALLFNACLAVALGASLLADAARPPSEERVALFLLVGLVLARAPIRLPSLHSLYALDPLAVIGAAVVGGPFAGALVGFLCGLGGPYGRAYRRRLAMGGVDGTGGTLAGLAAYAAFPSLSYSVGQALLATLVASAVVAFVNYASIVCIASGRDFPPQEWRAVRLGAVADVALSCALLSPFLASSVQTPTLAIALGSGSLVAFLLARAWARLLEQHDELALEARVRRRFSSSSVRARRRLLELLDYAGASSAQRPYLALMRIDGLPKLEDDRGQVTRALLLDDLIEHLSYQLSGQEAIARWSPDTIACLISLPPGADVAARLRQLEEIAYARISPHGRWLSVSCAASEVRGDERWPAAAERARQALAGERPDDPLAEVPRSRSGAPAGASRRTRAA
jgi:GGDEF domain-containing protein